MSSQTKIDLTGYWYDFYLKEITKNQYEKYFTHYKKHNVAVNTDDDDWSELRSDTYANGLAGEELFLSVNNIEIKNIHRLIKNNKNFSYSTSSKFIFSKNSYYWISYDCYKSGLMSIETNTKFDFNKLNFCAEEIYLTEECWSNLITSVTYDGEDLEIEDGGWHKDSAEWLIKT